MTCFDFNEFFKGCINGWLKSRKFEKAFEYFEATADVGFYAYGGSLEKAYENAGLAMFNVISDTRKIRQKESRHIEVISEDLVSLYMIILKSFCSCRIPSFYYSPDLMLKSINCAMGTLKFPMMSWRMVNLLTVI